MFRPLFREYGLSSRIPTDNGVPFATVSLARLSSLPAWWVHLGVLPEFIEPGRPRQNGRQADAQGPRRRARPPRACARNSAPSTASARSTTRSGRTKH